MIIMIVFIALVCFMFGFLLGVCNEPPARPVTKKYKETNDSEEFEKLKQDYANFLNYDGSEQA